ncbi:MAG: hypothetical protein H7Y31_08280 [Chitinophagaceae bacterium]|nr:hypothetical protein [Chitinophagaceae bacterium]
MKKLILFTGFLLAFRSEQAHSQSIGNWTFNNTLAGTGTPFNLPGAVTLGSAVGSGAFNGGTEYYVQSGWPASGIDLNAYIEFSVTPIAFYVLDITSINLRMRRSNTGSPSGSGPTSWAVRSSVDGFTNDLGNGSMTHNYANYLVTIPAINGIATTVTFRVYGFNSTTGTGGSSRLVLDNISLLGATGALAVKMNTLDAMVKNDAVVLKWSADDVIAGTTFSIEESTDGYSFRSIHQFIENQSKQKASYSHQTKLLHGKSLYRIKMKTSTLEVTASNVVPIVNTSSGLTIESVIAVGEQLNVAIHIPTNGVYSIQLFDTEGKLLFNVNKYLLAGSTTQQVLINNNSKRIMLLKVSKGSATSTRRFIL